METYNLDPNKLPPELEASLNAAGISSQQKEALTAAFMAGKVDTIHLVIGFINLHRQDSELEFRLNLIAYLLSILPTSSEETTKESNDNPTNRS